MAFYRENSEKMSSIMLLSALIIILLHSTLNGQTAISYGDCIEDSIKASEMDVYSFWGSNKDIIAIQAVRLSGSLYPRIEVYQGASLVLVSTGNPTARIDTLKLLNTGVYSVVVLDGFNGRLEGAYRLCLQRTFTPLKASSIRYGMSISDTLRFTGCINAYTFAGTANDIITIQMSRFGGSLYPRFELYNPGGSLLKKITGNPTARIDTLRLENTGSFTIFAVDGFNGTLAGQYALWLQRTFNPERVDTVAYGQTVAGSINMAARKNTYVFWGNNNDIISIQMSRTAGSLYSQIDLYTPKGALLMRETGNPTARIQIMTLIESGYYTICAGDGFNGTLNGSYALDLKKISNVANRPVNGLPEEYGLYQNYPNPFNPITSIVYELPEYTPVELTVFDISGQQVRKLVKKYQAAGQYTIQWDGSCENGTVAPSGAYLIQLRTKEFIQAKKMLLLR